MSFTDAYFIRCPVPLQIEAAHRRQAFRAGLHAKAREVAEGRRLLPPPPVKPAFRMNIDMVVAYRKAHHQVWIIFSEALRHVAETHVPNSRQRLSDIRDCVAEYYGTTSAEIISTRRQIEIVKPRQIGVYLCFTMTAKSKPEIGRAFGGRDHTTVLHAIRKYARLVVEDAAIAAEIEDVKQFLALRFSGQESPTLARAWEPGAMQ